MKLFQSHKSKQSGVRLATIDDLSAMMDMYFYSRTIMRSMGNTVQWVGYPTREQVGADIALEQAYIIEREGERVGCFALIEGEEPTYAHIEHGRWIDTERRYATLHRLACVHGVHGVAAEAFAFAKSRHSYLRCDTHISNVPMLHILPLQGFVHSGTVYMSDHTPREAYEWWAWDEVSERMHNFVDNFILPMYDSFDAAHQRSHALRVIARAMCIGLPLRLKPDLIYAAAAMHDVGLGAGREYHQFEGGKMVRQDSYLHAHYPEAEVEMIAQAVEDHRASSGCPPRSLLGRVVADADRDVEPERVVRRTIEFGLKKYPSLSREEHWRRMVEHLEEKYGRQGYLKLPLPDSINAAPLEELRQLIDNKTQLRKLFDHYMPAQ